jgi:hypothetical protein
MGSIAPYANIRKAWAIARSNICPQNPVFGCLVADGGNYQASLCLKDNAGVEVS